MNLKQRLLVKKYLDILLRRYKIIFVGVLVGLITGLGLYLKTSKSYRCEALMQYQQQGINPTALSPDDRSHPRNIVNTVKEQVLSRTSLEGIIKEHRLYQELLQRLPLEDVVENMRGKIVINAAGRGGEVYRISFLGSNPRKVMLVTNSLASKFIEENLRFRQEKVSETSNYIEDELKMAQAALDKKEAVMRDYKLEHYNEMPDQRVMNINRLNALQGRFQQSIESSHTNERTIVLIQEQISLREQLLSNISTQAISLQQPLPQQEGQVTAKDIYNKLQQLKTRYTENHPEVKRLQKLLDDLGGWQTKSGEEKGKGNASRNTQSEQLDPQILQLKHQLRDLKENLSRSKTDREKLSIEIQKLQSRIDAGPVREAEWSALTRDYEQLQTHYQELVRRNLQAESAQSLEKRQQGSQFKIIDPARLPIKPFKPNFIVIMFGAIVLSIGASGALAIGIDVLSTSFRDPQELESFMDLPIVSVIPLVKSQKELRREKTMHVIWWFCLVVLFVAILISTAYLWHLGIIII